MRVCVCVSVCLCKFLRVSTSATLEVMLRVSEQVGGWIDVRSRAIAGVGLGIADRIAEGRGE